MVQKQNRNTSNSCGTHRTLNLSQFERVVKQRLATLSTSHSLVRFTDNVISYARRIHAFKK